MPIAPLRAILLDQARRGETITYKALADRLGLVPPGTIRQLTTALEGLMAADAAAGRPFLAALAVGRGPDQLPGRGFFLLAAELGRHDGPPEGPAAAAFHAAELHSLLAATAAG